MESAENRLPPVSNTFAPAPRRSLLRRLAPWAASIGLFASGGYGVYLYATPQAKVSAEASEETPQRSTARQSVEGLFSSSSSEPVSSLTNETDERGHVEPQDRYAYTPAAELSSPPQLPPTAASPADAQREAAAAMPDVQNPFSASPAASGGRYASSPVEREAEAAPTVQPQSGPSDAVDEDDALESSSDLREADAIARGQGPDYNPMRSNEPEQAAGDQEARFAFAEGAPQPQAGGNGSPPDPAAEDRTLAHGDPAATGTRPTSSANPYAQPGYASQPYEPQVAEELQPEVAAQAEPLPLQQAPYGAAPSGEAHPDALGSGKSQIANPDAQAQQPGSPLAETGLTPTPGISTNAGTGRPGERILEGAQNPAIVIQKLAPAEIQVGKKCTFAIRVQNHGQRAAQGVRIVDEVPMGTTLIGTAPRASVVGTQVEWDLGTLSVGEERIVEMELLPTTEGEVGSVATVVFAAQASARARCTKPELALRLTSQPTVMIGERQIIQIEVTNPGSGDATGVVLLESIPEGVTHQAGPTLEYPIGTLRAGESRRIDLELSAVQAGRVNNVMTARADANLQVQANCEFEVLAPDLRVSVNGPKRRYLERPAKYTVTINNPGTASAREVQLVTQLPQGLQFVSADNYGEYDQATHSIHWSLEELPAGKDGAVELVALPVESGEHKLQIATKAQQGLEDHAEQSVTVDGLAALMFEVVDVQDPIEVGGETTYEIRVVNQGSKSAANVQIIALFPRGMRAMSAQGATQFQIQGEAVRFDPLPRLAPKAESTFRVTAQGTLPGDQRVRVQVTADEFEQPITKEASTRVYADE